MPVMHDLKRKFLKLPRAIEIRYALIVVLFTFLWWIFEYLLGVHDIYIRYNLVFSILGLSVIGAGTMLSIWSRREDRFTGLSFSEAFKSGMIVTLIVVIFTPLVQFFFHTVINPEYLPNLIERSVNLAYEYGRSAHKARELGISLFTVANMMWIVPLGYLISGAAFSAVGAYLFRTT